MSRSQDFVRTDQRSTAPNDNHRSSFVPPMTVGINHLVHHQLNSIKEYFKFQTTHQEKGHEFFTTSLPPTIPSVSAAEEVHQIHGRKQGNKFQRVVQR